MKILLFTISFFLFFFSFSARAADLKQLAEQLVNVADDPAECVDNDCDGPTDAPAIRDAGRTVSAGQIKGDEFKQKDDSDVFGQEQSEQRTGRNPQTGKEIKIPAKYNQDNNSGTGDGEVEEKENLPANLRKEAEKIDNRRDVSEKGGFYREGEDDDIHPDKGEGFTIRNEVVMQLKKIKNLTAAEKQKETSNIKESIIDNLSKYNLKNVEVEIIDQDGKVQAVVHQIVEKKLFWFIPVKAKVEVLISDDGQVEVKKPWYSFLLGGFDIENIW